MASSLSELATELVWCEVCRALPGSVCVVVRGRTAGRAVGRPHAARTRPLEAAWRLGYSDGSRVQTELVRRRLEQERVCSVDQLQRVTRLGL